MTNLNKITINHEHFRQSDPPEKKPLNKKYNIKINNYDLALLDAMAENDGITRSALLNNILHQLLEKSLQGEIKDGDAQLLIASEADKLVRYENSGTPWIYSVLPKEFQQLLMNIFEHNYINAHMTQDYHMYTNSQTFKLIQQAIKDAQNVK